MNAQPIAAICLPRPAIAERLAAAAAGAFCTALLLAGVVGGLAGSADVPAGLVLSATTSTSTAA